MALISASQHPQTASFTVDYEVIRLGSTLQVLINSAAKPTNGTWNVGDEFVHMTAGAGGIPRSRCVIAGAPGTIKNYAALEA